MRVSGRVCVHTHQPSHKYWSPQASNWIGRLCHVKERSDPGRFNVTRNEADRGAFKTPTLRSVELSGPYFHDGSAASLKEVVRYMASGGKPDPNKSPLLQSTGLTEVELDKIVLFLNTLTSTEGSTQPKLP